MGGGYLAWVEHNFPVTKPEDADQKKPEDELPKKEEDVDQQKETEAEL